MTLLEQEDNEVDTETLQSQIDLSMSLVHDLVSSWVKPAPGGTKQSNYDAQKDLEEYMRRPARLGVGAPIPTSSITSRDAVRLKNRLADRKRRIYNERSSDDAKAHHSDEEESRSGVIRKKLKVDPFGYGKKNMGLPTPEGSQNHEVLSSKHDNSAGSSQVLMDSVSSEPIPSKDSPTKKQKSHSQASGDTAMKLVSPPLTPARATVPKAQHHARGPTIPKDNLLFPAGFASATSQERNPPGGGDYSLPNSVSTSSIRILQQSPSSARKVPLLNLEGPPPDVNDSEIEQSKISSPGKKRRRRKKKKKTVGQSVTESGEMTKTNPNPTS